MKKKGGMKKRVVRKKVVRKKFLNQQVRKTLPYQLLIIFLIILVLLIISWVILFLLGKVPYFPKEDGLEGELGALKWDFGGDDISLNILDYNISGDNQTIDANVNWSSGEDETLESILFVFTKPEGDCNYTQTSNLPNFGENKVYNVNEIDCDTGNFENVTDVDAYAEINITLVQLGTINDITIPYQNQNKTNAFDLDSYFSCETDNLSFNLVPGANINVDVDENNVVDIYPAANWSGTRAVSVTANCNNEQISDSFSVIVSDEILNYAPVFLMDVCGEFELLKNVNLTVDMSDCWTDRDRDTLNLTYGSFNASSSIRIINESDTEVLFAPYTNFVGKVFVYFYANDSINSRQGKVYVDVIASLADSSADDSDDDSDSTNPKIKTSNPVSTSVTIFPNASKTFSITAENYETIKWYLNGELIEGATNLSYKLEGLDEGEHIIKVEVVNGSIIDSKTWNISIGEEEDFEWAFDIGKVVFYSSVAVILIITLLIVWLFIAEKNSRKKKINYMGFGVSGPLVRVKPDRRRPGPSSSFIKTNPFNIPS